MLECIVDFLCLAVSPCSWSVTSQHTWDVSTTVLVYIYICQGKYRYSNLIGQGELPVKDTSTVYKGADKGTIKQKTLYTYLSIHPI